MKRAAVLAKQKQHSYQNSKGETVTWTLQEIKEVKEILSRKLTEGTEVYYSYFTRLDPK